MRACAARLQRRPDAAPRRHPSAQPRRPRLRAHRRRPPCARMQPGARRPRRMQRRCWARGALSCTRPRGCDDDKGNGGKARLSDHSAVTHIRPASTCWSGDTRPNAVNYWGCLGSAAAHGSAEDSRGRSRIPSVFSFGTGGSHPRSPCCETGVVPPEVTNSRGERTVPRFYSYRLDSLI